MRLATFNIAWLGDEEQISRTEEDLGRIARVIARLDADAMVFQEIVKPEQLEHMLDQAGGLTNRVYRMRDDQGRLLGSLGHHVNEQKVIAAYDSRRYALLAGSPIVGGPGRPPYALRLRSVADGDGQVLVVGVHFQSGFPDFTDAGDAQRRRKQCQHLADWIQGAKADQNPELPAPLPDEHVAILGDFNALFDTDGPGFEIIVRSLDPLRTGPMAEWWWEKPLPDPAGGGQTTSYGEGYLIDFVMLSPSLKDRIVTPPTIYAFDRDDRIGGTGDCQKSISDHRPVFVEIDIGG